MSLAPEAIVHDDEGDLEIRIGDVRVRMPIEDWLTSALVPRARPLKMGASLFTLLQAKQQRDNKWSIATIAAYHEVSPRTVHRWFRRLGIPAKVDNKSQYAPLREKAREMVAAGKGREEIAEALGVSPNTVSQWSMRMAL